jgi:hypothetical protein
MKNSEFKKSFGERMAKLRQARKNKGAPVVSSNKHFKFRGRKF